VNALNWDHNAYYHRLLLRHLPRPCNRVLDVGCGAGAFAVELAKRAERVDALDRSPAMIEQARHHTSPPEALPRLAGALRPGGVLAAAALPRRDLLRELPAELTAAIGYRLFGAAFAILRTIGRRILASGRRVNAG
jgi:hypothetical protein